MGRLVVTEFVTLDGVFEDPGGAEQFEHGGWSFTFDQGPDGAAFKMSELLAADAQLLGRVTYDGFAKAWPTMEGTGEFGEKMNSMPKYVASRTLRDEAASWRNTTVIRGDLAVAVTALKDEFAGDILVAGSATLVGFLAGHDLVDEYRLMVFPLVLGAGRRLFPEGFAVTRLALTSAAPVGPDGVVILTYARAATTP